MSAGSGSDSDSESSTLPDYHDVVISVSKKGIAKAAAATPATPAAQAAGTGGRRVSAAQKATDARLKRLRRAAEQLEIKNETIEQLRQLEDWDVVFVLDDSKSMQRRIASGGARPSDPFSATRTRWDELCETVKAVVMLASSLDTDGVDIWFLKRQGAKGVTTIDEVEDLFEDPPTGKTYISAKLEEVLADLNLAERDEGDKGVLIVLATDGLPREGQDVLRETLLRLTRDHNIHLSLLAITDDDATVKYFHGLDRALPHCDINDDYGTEAATVRRAQGGNFQFSYGDYVAKCLLGAIDERWDQLNEDKPQECCVIL